MNIAILIPGLNGGGAERVAQIIGDYYVENGNNVYYIIADLNIKQDYPVKGSVIRTDITSCMEGEFSTISRILKLINSSIKIRKLKREYKIDVAISFMEEFNYMNILSKGREKVITRVCTILSERKELEGFLYKKVFVRFLYSKADCIVVMSQYALEDMCFRYGIPLNKIVKIPNPVQSLDEKEIRDMWDFGSKAVICVGRLEAVKQQERIIRAFSCVNKKIPDARLVILGRGARLRYLKYVCGKYQVENSVSFVGFTNSVSYYLQHGRVFVMASRTEGFPNSMIEAMHYGLPVVTTDSPGACGEIVGNEKRTKEITYCKYGILTSPMPEGRMRMDSPISEQELALAEAICCVLDNDNLYCHYHDMSIERAKMFRLDKVMKQWNEIIS